MARIQNPQNEKGIKLATVDDVSSSIKDLVDTRISSLEEQLSNGFENIITSDQFISIDKTESENNLVESSISLKVTENTNDIDTATTNNNKLVTSKVLKDVTDSIGLTIKHDTNSDYTTTEDETLKNKIKGINFFGEYVNVIENEDGETINLYIGKNNNNPSYNSINDSSFNNSNYVYASSTNSWVLPADAKAGTPYERTSGLSETETIKLNNGNLIGNILADQIITITVTTDKKTITYNTDKISEHCGTVNSPNAYAWEDKQNGIKVTGINLIKYSKTDVQNGFTPNSSTGIFTIDIKNSIVGEGGGWYNVSVELGGTKKTTNNVFVYPSANKNPSVGKPTLTYGFDDNNKRFISGIEYYSSGTCTLMVNDIKNTQQAITKDKKRLQLTQTTGNNGFDTVVETDTEGMTCVNDSPNYETAIYKFEKEIKVESATAKKVSIAFKAQAYGQTGEPAGEAQGSDIATTSTYIYTPNSDDTDLISYFQQDGKRVYNTLNDIKEERTTINEYISTKSLKDDYTSQLLIQDGKLRYPTKDTTSKYTNAMITGTRYYVRPVKFNGTGQINTISITVNGMSAFNNKDVRLYLVKKGVSDAQVLNWFKTATCSYGVPIADVSAPSSNKWTCTINNDVFQLQGGIEDTYYLVVEMTEDADEIGQITLA